MRAEIPGQFHNSKVEAVAVDAGMHSAKSRRLLVNIHILTVLFDRGLMMKEF
jgi:hypothetical protein